MTGVPVVDDLSSSGPPQTLPSRLRDGDSGPGRFIRYAGASIIAFVLAQVGLAVGYGLFRWGVPASVVLSLAVSVGPAYLMNRRYVWPHPGDGSSRVSEVNGFVAVAVIGTLTTIVVVAVAESLARHLTHDHLTLTAIVNVASILATGIVWILRYVVLDRFVFPNRGVHAPRGFDR